MESPVQNPFPYLFSKVWQYAGNRRLVVTYWIMFIVATSLPLFGQPLVWAAIMNTAQSVIEHKETTSAALEKVFFLLGLIGLIEIGHWLLHGPARVLERRIAFNVRANYRSYLLKGILTLPLDWHAEHHSGRINDQINKGTTALFDFAQVSFQSIYLVCQLTGSYSMLIYFSPPAGIIVAVMIGLSAYITIRFDRILMAQQKEINRAENTVSESMADTVSNITTVIVLRVEKFLFESIMRKVYAPLSLIEHNNKLNEWKWFLAVMCCRAMTILVLGVYFWQNIDSAEGILAGTVFLLIQYLNHTGELFYHFTNIYGGMVKRCTQIENAEEVAQDFRPANFSNHVLPKSWHTLTIENLTFSYNVEGRSLHLNGVNLSIVRGERIALVGETGSGKTTLLKVMRDLYHPQDLSLSVDGKSIPHGFEGISRAIALVPQDPEIFATTILDNITLGAEHDMNVVRRFTEMACFTAVAEGLPNGFRSSIKEKGVNLSGGQQQRLALSRGLLACEDKDIVLLDEPTSSLDAVTEMKVYQNILREFRGKTVISSIHRLHLLPLFDRICLFEDGRITASGTLPELLSSSPRFALLWETVQRMITEDPAK